MQQIFAGLANLFVLPGAFLALIGGTLAGVAVGLMPGVNSRSGLLIAIPFMLAFDPMVGAIFLVSLHAASQVSGTVPAVVFGAPTSASEAATAMDGYPLALRGEGARVIGTIISASAVGGVAGALVLLLFAPFASGIILSIGSPEIAALATGGILAIAAVSSTGLAAGVAMGAAGILCSTVGMDALTAIPRFTFGADRLLDGLAAPALIAGMMAIPELLKVEQGRVGTKVRPTYRRVVEGLVEPFRHWGLTLRASIIGLIVGATPGIGASVAVWLSYGQATRTESPETPFGQGAIEGVVAPEVAGGSKEGGAFIPTLLLGVPGSSGMAIILAAFATIGIHVGPTLLTSQSSLPSTVAWTVAGADVLGLLVCIAFAPYVVKLASLPRPLIAVLSLTAACAAAYYTAPYSQTALQIALFGALGVVFTFAGLSRPAFLIGFVIGPVFESALIRSSKIYGFAAMGRPGVLIILVIIAAAVIYLLHTGKGSRPGSRSASRAARPSRDAMTPLLGLAGVFGAAIALAQGYRFPSSFVPTVAASAGFLGALVGAWQAFRAERQVGSIRFDWLLAGLSAVGLVAAASFGALALLLPLVALVFPRRAGAAA